MIKLQKMIPGLMAWGCLVVLTLGAASPALAGSPSSLEASDCPRFYNIQGQCFNEDTGKQVAVILFQAEWDGKVCDGGVQKAIQTCADHFGIAESSSRFTWEYKIKRRTISGSAVSMK